MKNTTVTPTLQSLIKQKIKEKGFSRAQLVSAIGYTNISKGCKRLDTFANTLEAPSEDFIINVATVLEIDPVTFCRTLAASQDQFSADAKRTFKPYVEILLGIQIRPFFAAQIVKNKCSIPVLVKFQNLPLEVEIKKVGDICKNHIDSVLDENISKHVVGFKYYREHYYYMRFDGGYSLEKTVFTQPGPSKKVLMGNRIVDMLSGGMG